MYRDGAVNTAEETSSVLFLIQMW